VTHQYAVEIVLTRRAAVRELHQTRHRVTYAANADRSRLMTVQRGKSPGRALEEVLACAAGRLLQVRLPR